MDETASYDKVDLTVDELYELADLLCLLYEDDDDNIEYYE